MLNLPPCLASATASQRAAAAATAAGAAWVLLRLGAGPWRQWELLQWRGQSTSSCSSCSSSVVVYGRWRFTDWIAPLSPSACKALNNHSTTLTIHHTLIIRVKSLVVDRPICRYFRKNIAGSLCSRWVFLLPLTLLWNTMSAVKA